MSDLKRLEQEILGGVAAADDEAALELCASPPSAKGLGIGAAEDARRDDAR